MDLLARRFGTVAFGFVVGAAAATLSGVSVSGGIGCVTFCDCATAAGAGCGRIGC